MTSTDVSPHCLKVAWVITGDLRPYRVPLLSRLATRTDIEVEVFHGPAKAGSGAPQERPRTNGVEMAVTELRSVRWPFGRGQVAWFSGTFRLLSSEYDVLVCQETVNNLSIWLFSLLHRSFGKRLVLHGWGYRPDEASTRWVNRIRQAARRILARRADAAIVYTDRGRRSYVRLGFPEDRISVSGNTLDVEHLRAIGKAIPQDELAQLRHTLAPEDRINLLFVGRLQAAKRVDILIDAFALLKDLDFPCTLTIIGDGPDRQELEERSDKLGGITFTGAIYDERVLAPYFIVADLLVIPGRVGLTCVHSFSYGVPVLTASHHVIPQTPEYDYVIDGVNGRIIDEVSAQAFSIAIQEIVAHSPQLERLKAGARSSADRLTMDQMAEQFSIAVHRAASREH